MARTKKTTVKPAVEVPARKEAPAVVQRAAQKVPAKAKTPPPPRVEEEELFEEEEDVEEEELEEEEEEDEEDSDEEEEDDDNDADTPPDDDDSDDDEEDDEDLTEEVEEEEEEEPEPGQVSLTWLTAEVVGDVREPDRPTQEIDENIRQIEAMKELMPDIAYRAAIDALNFKKQELSGVHVFLQENDDAARLEQSAVALALALHDTLQQIEALITAHNQREDIGTHQRVTFSGIDLRIKPYNGEQGVGIEGGYEVYTPRAVRSSRNTTSRRGRGGNTRLGSYSVLDVYQYLVNNGQPRPVARHKYGGQYYYAILEGDRLREAEFKAGKASAKDGGRVWDSFNQWVNEWHKSTNAWLRLELKLPDGAAKQRNYGWNTDDRGEPIVDSDWQTDADRLRKAMSGKAAA